MICPICFQNIKKIKKLECSHEFCYYCILEWYEKSNLRPLCPICRKIFNFKNYHNYNTRLNYYKKNKDKIITDLKNLMYGFPFLEDNDKIERFHEIFHFIYQNKNLLKDKNFKKIIIEKIQYLKKKNVDIGFYWDQKIYN
tara:strand:+ start:1984 stop:2403 length:420 start_codon:yes stop_codon:yes gene_type:complete